MGEAAGVVAAAAESLAGWGRTAPTVATTRSAAAVEVPELVRRAGPRGLLARGLGRSHGDAAQNAGGQVLLPLPSWSELDPEAEVVRVSAGTSLHELMRHLVPRGFFVPVTPGTRYVTVGGAVAADIHGKNHHRLGSFGEHVLALELVTADGTVRSVGPDADPELFWATVGGMGLTGVVTEVTLRVIPVESGWMRVETSRVPDLETLMRRMREADATATYSVAWIDTLATGRRLGRSVLTTGEHARAEEVPPGRDRWVVPPEPRLRAPAWAPTGLVSRPTVRLFNEAWFRKAPRQAGSVQTVAAFFHPLDGVAQWNRLYGRPGFVQYQMVIPDQAEALLPELLERFAAAGHPAFLSVVKRFGPGSGGLLSFPMRGWTLALDIPARPSLHRLFGEVDALVVGAGGRLYLAKDSRMDPALLPAMYPDLDRFRRVRDRVDPRRVFQSDLARRLGL